MQPKPGLTKEQASAIASALALTEKPPQTPRVRIGLRTYLALLSLLVVSAVIVYYSGLGATVALVVYIAAFVGLVGLKIWAARSGS